MKMKNYIALALISFITAACSMNAPHLRHETAQRLSAPAYMIERNIAAHPFLLTAFERVHEKHKAANIYIEGDGLAWVSRNERSHDPTPTNPIGLHLAAMDKADNVIYLARPCQYTRTVDPDAYCDKAYWGEKRFAPEVIKSYMFALDEIKSRYKLSGFNLIGYSGGGAIAALLAAERSDVLTLRTVAGNIDHEAHTQLHKVTAMDESLNPPDFAKYLARMPQIHFVGGHDDNVPIQIADSYVSHFHDDSCIKIKTVHDAAHENGWVNQWPELLKEKPSCARKSPDMMDYDVDYDMPAPPIVYERPSPAKP